MQPRKIMWSPNDEQIAQAQMTLFRQLMNQKFGLEMINYADLYNWSVDQAETFWEEIWNYGGVISHSKYTRVVDDLKKMPGATWFEGATLNFAENLLRYRDQHIAIHFWGEDQVKYSLTYSELYTEVAKAAHALQQIGVQSGDRVAGFIPNLPEAVIAMLATASLGAVWSSTSPDFGISGVLDRFSQIEPKVIFAADGYLYGGKRFDTLSKLNQILDHLPTVEKVILVNYTDHADTGKVKNSILWKDFTANQASDISFVPLPFNHPLYIMYSSGTTGLPKSIVHSSGGTLLQHIKEHSLHCDLKRSDTIFYYTTCGWMMWNWLVSALTVGASLVLYDGNPFYPNKLALWHMVNKLDISVFGTSAKYLSALESEAAKPGRQFDLSSLRAVLSTGSTLMEESFDFVYRDIKKDLMLSSISGGTDIISCFALGNPVLPVVRGELQCRGLGMKVESYTESGESLKNQSGELVCTQAFPSMPTNFWNDEGGEKYHKAYFQDYPGIWKHGDFIEINDDGGVRIFGRSDATLNPGGVRIGTSEIYTVVDQVEQVEDSVVIGQNVNGDERIVLFVKLWEGEVLDADLKLRIRNLIKQNCSPRHVPAIILQVSDIPYTINGKKVEVAVKQTVQGTEVKNLSALANPESLLLYQNLDELRVS